MIAHDFEKQDAIINPRIEGKVIFFNRRDGCYTLGGRNKSMFRTGVEYDHEDIDCPNGIDPLLENCMDGMFKRAGKSCVCEYAEGNPPGTTIERPCPGK